jgi:hypothetical protein
MMPVSVMAVVAISANTAAIETPSGAVGHLSTEFVGSVKIR